MYGKKLRCLIETGTRIALAMCAPVWISHPRFFLDDFLFCSFAIRLCWKKGSSKCEGLKHVTHNFYRHLFLLNYFFLTFWNFRLVRLYVMRDPAQMGTPQRHQIGTQKPCLFSSNRSTGKASNSSILFLHKNTCPNLWECSCAKCYGMDCPGKYLSLPKLDTITSALEKLGAGGIKRAFCANYYNS